ncbi:MAG TPA: sigma-70 family RNA polymerase sigma factor [Propionibacteriaceae bacterium]|nr:sigma-70 family RNA polymerase sigma factor [Propionibacteriaceae bacterium]
MTAVVTDEAFAALVEPLRGELTAHCYRLLGSVHDAQDLVQETYLRAWRAYEGFEQRSSIRTWMYQIATNTCLTALHSAARRPLPTGLGQPSSDPLGRLDSSPETPWLEPLPDRLVWGSGEPNDPAAEVVSRESVRLAFVAALQHLTPQQRAVLILRDVLAWRASEVAATLGMTTAGVNSTLQRARAHVARLDSDETPELPDDDHAADLLERYVAAFESYDVAGIVSLLKQDAVWEMPPYTGWYQGAAEIGQLIATNCPASGAGDMQLVPTSANGQPAFAVYMRDPDGVHRAFQIQQLTISGRSVSHVMATFDLRLFETFGLPDQL